MPRVCASCQRRLGEMETGYRWGQQTVCAACAHALSQPQHAAAGEAHHDDAHTDAGYDPSTVCQSCGGVFESEDLTQYNGQTICTSCEIALVARSKTKSSKSSSTRKPPPKPKSNAMAYAVVAAVVLAGGGGAWYYMHKGGESTSQGNTQTMTASNPAKTTTPTVTQDVAAPAAAISWADQVLNATVAGEHYEMSGTLPAARDQFHAALELYPQTLTPEQATRKDQLATRVAKLEERISRPSPKPQRGIWAFGGPFVAYNRMAPEPVAPKDDGPLFAKEAMATTAPATRPAETAVASADKPKTAAKSSDDGMDKMDRPDKSMEKSMDSMDSMKKGSGKDAMMDKGMDSMDGPRKGSSDSATAKRNADKPADSATSKPADQNQELFGNVAAKLGMNSRRGKQAMASGQIATMTDEQKALLLLDEGQVEEAGKAFEAILEKDPNSSVAHSALGCIELFGNHRAEGQVHFEKALAIKSGDRVAAIDLAALVLDEDPTRSVRILRTYLSSNGPLDEQAQNALGTALVRAEKQSQNRAYLLESRDFYVRYDQRLNATHTDGKKRWGNQWVDAAIADRKWATLLNAGYGLEDAHAQWPTVDATRKKTWDAWVQSSRNVVTTAQLEAARDNFKTAAQAELDLFAKIRKLDGELTKAETPPFAGMIEVVLPQ